MKDRNINRNRYYGIRIGDIVIPRGGRDYGHSEVIDYGFMDNNKVIIRSADGTEFGWPAEWCDIITKVEDREDFKNTTGIHV